MIWTCGLSTALKLAVGTLTTAALVLIGTAKTALPVNGQAATHVVHTQDVWLFSDFKVADATGAITDIMPQLLSAANAGSGSPVDLGHGLSYSDAPSLVGMASDGSGMQLANVTVHFGIVTTPAGPVFTAFASPDISQSQVSLDVNSSASIDLATVANVPVATGGTVSYLFQQMLTPPDPTSEAGLGDVAILAQRWRQGNFQQLGAADGGGKLQPGLVIDAPLTIGRPSSSVESRFAGYLQTSSSTGWQKFGAASVRAVGQISSGISQLFGGGAGPVSAQQATTDNDPNAADPAIRTVPLI